MEKTEPHPVVANCAKLREEPRPPMTVGEALAKVRWFREQPGVTFDTVAAKQVMNALAAAIEANPCYHKALLANQEVFVLRQHDRAAVRTIMYWAEQAEAHGASADKVSSARAKASRWQAQPDSETRWPT